MALIVQFFGQNSCSFILRIKKALVVGPIKIFFLTASLTPWQLFQALFSIILHESQSLKGAKLYNCFNQDKCQNIYLDKDKLNIERSNWQIIRKKGRHIHKRQKGRQTQKQKYKESLQ